MANVMFKKGLLSALPQTKVAGTIYVTTDERAMYLDVSNTERIRLGDFIEYDSWSAIQSVATTNLSTSALYYAKAENILAKWNGTNWVQINPDNYVYTESVAVTASGTENVVNILTELNQKNEDQTVYGKVSDTLTIKGAGSTAVSVDSEGAIIITSTDNNTNDTVTEASKHYVPEAEDASKISVSAGQQISAIARDSRGHVTGVETVAENDIDTLTISTTAAEGKATITAKAKTVRNTEKTDSFTLAANGDARVTVDTNTKTVTISANDSKVTSVENHYTPTGGTEKKGTGKFLTGVTVDAAGHITAVTGEDANFETVSKVEATLTNGAEGSNESNFTVGVTHGGEIKNDSITIKGAGATSVSSNGEVLTISSADTKVTSVDNHYKTEGVQAGTIAATGGAASTTLGTTQVVTGVTIDAAGHVTGVTAAGIKDTHANLKSLAINNKEADGFTVTVTDTDDKLVTTDFNPAIAIGANNTLVHAANGTWDLDVYTTAEVDNKITTAIGASKAIVLKGELNSENPLPTKVEAGDAYIVTEDFIYGERFVETGDLFVAKEDSEASTDANWYYIPAGDDKTTLVKATDADGNTVLQLKQGTEGAVRGGIKFVEANGIAPTINTAFVGTVEVHTVSFAMTWGDF